MVVLAIYQTLTHLVMTKAYPYCIIFIAHLRPQCGPLQRPKSPRKWKHVSITKSVFFLSSFWGQIWKKSFTERQKWVKDGACMPWNYSPKSPTPPFDGWPELFVDVFADVASLPLPLTWNWSFSCAQNVNHELTFLPFPPSFSCNVVWMWSN